MPNDQRENKKWRVVASKDDVPKVKAVVFHKNKAKNLQVSSGNHIEYIPDEIKDGVIPAYDTSVGKTDIGQDK